MSVDVCSIVSDVGDEIIEVDCSAIYSEDKDDDNVLSVVYCSKILFSVESELDDMANAGSIVVKSEVSVICCDTVWPVILVIDWEFCFVIDDWRSCCACELNVGLENLTNVDGVLIDEVNVG